jgi:arabinose-5-phosphate isomerase
VADIFRTGDKVPRSAPGDLLPQAIVEMTGKGIGMTCVVDPEGRLLGIFTDGDLRRTLEKHDVIRNLRVEQVMTRNPRSIAPERLAAEAAQILEKQSLGGRLVVLDPDGRLLGALTFHDLLAAGVV